MATFTLPGGMVRSIPAMEILRFRASFTWENGGHIGTTLFAPMLIVQEPLMMVGTALQAERASFIALPGVRDRAQWVDAARAADAEPPRLSESGNDVRSVVLAGGVRLRLTATVEEAQAALDAARGALTV